MPKQTQTNHQYSLYFENFKEYPIKFSQTNTIKIGNVVWIGDDVTLLPNINIGDGVCIGAGSIVTKDVPDYAIVAGNPARIIKYRFNELFIDIIENINVLLSNRGTVLKSDVIG